MTHFRQGVIPRRKPPRVMMERPHPSFAEAASQPPYFRIASFRCGSFPTVASFSVLAESRAGAGAGLQGQAVFSDEVLLGAQAAAARSRTAAAGALFTGEHGLTRCGGRGCARESSFSPGLGQTHRPVRCDNQTCLRLTQSPPPTKPRGPRRPCSKTHPAP